MVFARWVRLICTLLAVAMGLCFPGTTAMAAARETSPQAIHGVLDLRNWNFAANSPIALNGTWTLYWNQLLTPEAVSETHSPGAPVKVPAVWQGQKVSGKSLPGLGYATYELTVELPKDAIRRPMALYMPGVATAYRLWVNGQPIAENGKVGTSLQTMVPVNVSKVVLFESDQSTVHMVIQVSNFVQRKGGLWAPIQLGFPSQIQAERERSIAEAVCVAACLLFLGIYHFVIYYLYRLEKAPLFLALLCFAIALRTMVVGDEVLITICPFIPWEIATKIEYLSVTLGLLYCTRLTRAQFPEETRGSVETLVRVVMSLWSLFILVCPARIYTLYMLPMQILIAVVLVYLVGASLLAAIRRRPRAGLNTLGIACFVAAAISDILYYNHVIPIGPMLPFGFLCFLFAQSLNLARRFASSFHRVDRLSNELGVLNASLEARIEERTAELTEALASLSASEEDRRQLIDDISHELGTPLAKVQGYVKAILDGIIRDNQTKYLQLVYDRTVFIGRMLKDLHQLTHLQARQLDFDYQWVSLKDWTYAMYEQFRPEVPGHSLQLSIADGVDTAGDVYVQVDPLRLEQVLSNLISNAVKYAPAGSEIQLELSTSRNEQGLSIAHLAVSDQGVCIPESERERIFRRFYRRKEIQANIPGAGLGLAICREIVRCLHGELQLTSQDGGNTFTISLPWQRFTQNSQDII